MIEKWHENEEDLCDYSGVRFRHLITEYKGIEKFYSMKHLEWNHWLNRYYPKAECYMILEKCGGDRE